jgi:hypothetical protein
MRIFVKTTPRLALLSVLWAFFAPAGAQPRAALTGANAVCASGPTLAGGVPDTLSPAEAAPDDSGFVRLFNGKNLKGWWEGCGSSHSSADNVNGGIWLVDSVNGLLFANQNANGAGSVLMTNKSFANYELVFDLWPGFGNDAGVFNRVTASGNCYQTGIDYITNSSVGGAYFEGGYTGGSRNVDPYVFGANKATITIGTNSNTTNRLDTLTKLYGNPSAFGCPAGGCGVSNWTAVWDTGGWNQMRVKFYGSGASASDKVHNFAWIRKLGATEWVPTLRDSVQYATPANPLGLQIHGTKAQWGNANGNWYRNIKLRPLNADGTPVVSTTRVSHGKSAIGDANFHLFGGILKGNLGENSRITVFGADGKRNLAFEASKGVFSRNLAGELQTTGLVFLRIEGESGRIQNGIFYLNLP